MLLKKLNVRFTIINYQSQCIIFVVEVTGPVTQNHWHCALLQKNAMTKQIKLNMKSSVYVKMNTWQSFAFTS